MHKSEMIGEDAADDKKAQQHVVGNGEVWILNFAPTMHISWNGSVRRQYKMKKDLHSVSTTHYRKQEIRHVPHAHGEEKKTHGELFAVRDSRRIPHGGQG